MCLHVFSGVNGLRGDLKIPTDVLTNLLLKLQLVTSGNWEVSDIGYTYSAESSEQGCETVWLL